MTALRSLEGGLAPRGAHTCKGWWMVSLAGHVATDHLLTLIKVPVLILGWTKRIVTVLWRAVFVKNETSNLSLTVVACIWEKVRSFIRTEGREEMMLLQVSAVVIFCYHWYVLDVWGPFVRKQWRWLHERFYTLQLPAKQVAALVFLFSFSFYQIKLKQRKKKQTKNTTTYDKRKEDCVWNTIRRC